MMKFIGLFILLFLAMPAGCLDAGGVEPTKGAPAKPVIVELYTSEGCSSCPPADKQLEFLSNQQPVTGVELITLAFHVDYWDSPAWKDRFSSHLFTQRQELYVRQLKLDSAYTPQLVIAGRKDVIATDFNKTLLAIIESAKAPSGSITAASDGAKAKIDVADLPEHGEATLYLAVTEDDLGSKVRGGENAGSRFRHMSVVRELRAVAAIPSGETMASVESDLPFSPQWKKENVRYVAFVQDNVDRKIIAAARIGK